MSRAGSLGAKGFSVGSELPTLASVRPRQQLEICSLAECSISYTRRAYKLSTR